MIYGILAGMSWALGTVILGWAMALSPLVSTERAIFLAPFVSTFLHDLFSALWAGAWNGLRGQLPGVRRALKTSAGRFVVLAAVIGGPVGMTGYVMAIHYMGASIGAVASAVFPAIGTALACIFLKERIAPYRWGFLLMTLLGVYGLSYSPELEVQNFWLGLLGAAMCAFGWGIEAVILARSMADPLVKDEYALQIRQTTSALVHGLVILPLLGGWDFIRHLLAAPSGLLLPAIGLAALCATFSYLCYYRAISRLGASRAMALNVTYAAWSMVFTVVLLGDLSVLTPVTVCCGFLVLSCSILAAGDFRKAGTNCQNGLLSKETAGRFQFIQLSFFLRKTK